MNTLYIKVPLSIQFVLWSGHHAQSDVQASGGRPVQEQTLQRADDVPHEGTILLT